MPSVYDYKNYRHYLRDVFFELKNSPSGFSYARFCRAIGLRSTNYLKLIIEGKRNLTPANALRLGQFLQLTFEEVRYLETLVHLNHSRTAGEKSHYASCLSALTRPGAIKYSRKPKQELLEKWYYPAVLVALHGCPAGESIERLARLVGLRQEEALAAEKCLLALGALALKDGRFEMADTNVLLVDGKKTRLRHKNFLRDQLKLSSEKLEKEYDREARFFSQTLSISSASWSSYVQKIRSLLTEMAVRSDRDSAEKLIQLNVQLFPIGPEGQGRPQRM